MAQLQEAEGRRVCGRDSGSRWHVLAESSFSREIGSGPPDEMEDGELERGGWEGGRACRFKVSQSEMWHVSFSSVQRGRQ